MVGEVYSENLKQVSQGSKWQYLVLGLVGTCVCLLVELVPLWDFIEDRGRLFLNCVAHLFFPNVHHSW